MDDPDSWANLGQGAPEVEDDIEGCFERPHSVEVTMSGREYGPTAGIKPLRTAIANLYNAHHRVGKESQYSWENVCVVPGGRAGLIRIAAVLGHAYLGFFMYAPSTSIIGPFHANLFLVRTTLRTTRCCRYSASGCFWN
jgi:hypothetical protein